MFTQHADQLAKQARWDRRRIVELLNAYQDPDPKKGATPETLPLFAQLVVPQAQELVETYEALAEQADAPGDIRIEATANCELALCCCGC